MRERKAFRLQICVTSQTTSFTDILRLYASLGVKRLRRTGRVQIRNLTGSDVSHSKISNASVAFEKRTIP